MPALRERLLEGFLLRLARAPDADAFALRGGMLVRSWGASRAIRDIDLVCALPFDARAIRARLRAILADRGVADDCVFDADRFRIDRWRWPERAGLTLYVAGDVDGEPAEMTADLWFGLDVWPAAQRGEVAMARGTIALALCPHELVIGTKLAVLAELGPRQWRAKDLADIWLALRRFPPRRSAGVLGEAIERRCGRAWQPMLSAAWWREPRAELRWARYGVPVELGAVVGEVRQALSPFGRRS